MPAKLNVNIFTFKEVRMQTLRMNTENLPEFLQALKDWGKVWAPVEREKKVFSLEPIDDVSKARPDALTTIIPFNGHRKRRRWF